MIEDVFGFDDLGRKVKIGEYETPDSVGGRIFYIDSSSDEIVEFYDSNGNVISNVVVGDTPSYYKITNTGISGKDKFYVYYEIVYEDKLWTYKDNGSWVYENVGCSGQVIGQGKLNTTKVISLRDGIYTGPSGTSYDTAWNAIKQCRLNSLGNCNDWYVGSKNEIDSLRSFVRSRISTLNLVNIFENNIWCSSEDSSNIQYAYMLDSSSGTWGRASKGGIRGVIPIRSF